MELSICEYAENDVERLCEIWNEVVADGLAFAGEKLLSYTEMKEMLGRQTQVNCAFVDGEAAGFYILHPNDIGRRSHIANASYAVAKKFQGCGIGRALVENSLQQAAKHGFSGLQFNAVVATNQSAIHLYRDLGFDEVGRIPGGFRVKDGSFVDLLMFFKKVG